MTNETDKPGVRGFFKRLRAKLNQGPAWLTTDDARTQAQLLEEATVAGYAPGVRLLTDVHPAADHGVPAFLGPLLSGGSLVLLRHPSDHTWAARAEDERADAELRAD